MGIVTQIIFFCLASFISLAQIRYNGVLIYMSSPWNLGAFLQIALAAYLIYYQTVFVRHCGDLIPDDLLVRNHSENRMTDECDGTIKKSRNALSMQALITSIQALFFLQNWDSFSPLISVFLLIIYEIRFFIFVVIIAMFGFSNAFFLIG